MSCSSRVEPFFHRCIVSLKGQPNKHLIDPNINFYALGSVEPFSDLACEVVFHPSYAAPDEGQFALQVHGGESLKLNCVSKVSSLFKGDRLVVIYHCLTDCKV